MLTIIHEAAEKAFHNRANEVENASKEAKMLIFESYSSACPCLGLGTFAIKDSVDILAYIASREWLDEDPRESCDVLQLFSAS